MLPENCKEVFKTAYANVRLNSDITWIAGVPDKFRKANLDLWVRHNIYTSECRNKADNSHSSSTDIITKICTVRDSIPVSCVAQYGNYVYNDDIREWLYAPLYTSPQYNEEFSIPEDKKIQQRDSCEELWMSPEVEEEFRRLTCVDSFEDQNLLTQQFTPFASSRWWNPASDNGSASRQLATFETRLPGIKEKYPELGRTAGNSQPQTHFPEDVAGSSDTHLVEPFEPGLLPVPCHTFHSPEEMQLRSRINSVKYRGIWARKAPNIPPNQSQKPQCLLRASRHCGHAISTVRPSVSCNPLSHRKHSPILNAGNTKYFTNTKARSTFTLNDDHQYVRTYFPTAFHKNYQSELFPYASVTETTTSFTSYDYSDTETTRTASGVSTLNTAGTTVAQQSNYHLWSAPQHAPTSSLLCRHVPQPIQQHSYFTSVSTQSHTSAPLSASSFCHQTSTCLISRSTPVCKSILEYQYSPGFCTHHQGATNIDTRTRNRKGQGECGMASPNLIFLTSRGMSHRMTQNNARREEPSIIRATAVIPAAEEQCWHLPHPNISGQEFFSDPPKRTTAHAKQEFEINNNLSLQHAARSLPDVTLSEHVQVTQRQFVNDTKITEPRVIKSSVLPSETQHKQKTKDENVQSGSKQDKENPSNEVTTDREHFSPLAAIDIKRRRSPMVITNAWPPLQTTVPTVNPHPDSSTVRVTGKSAASTHDCGQRTVNKNRKLYSDVLERKSTADPSAAVSKNRSERRYKELEEQHRPTAHNGGERFQQQQTPEDSIPGVSEVTTDIEVPAATAQPAAWITPSRRRTKKSSKSLPVNGSTKPSVTTASKVEATIWRAGGEKEGPSMKAGRIRKRRCRIRKEQPLALPTDLADIQAGTEGPQVVAAPELRRVCQTVGPGKAPRRQKATKCNIQVNVSRSTERTTIGRKERRKRRHTQQNDKQSGLINCSREGRKAEKHHEQELVRKNSNEQQAQISEKFQLQPANTNERNHPRSVACNSSTSATGGCVEVPEGSAGRDCQCHETADSNSNCHRDASTGNAVSVTDNSEQNKTHEEARTENTDNSKRPSWMKKRGKKQRAARKKKTSKKRGECCNTNITEPDQNYNQTLKITDLGSACNLFEKNYESSSEENDSLQQEDANEIKTEQHNKMKVISNQLRDSEEICNDRNELVKELEEPANICAYPSAKKAGLRPILRTIHSEELGDFSDYDSPGTDLVKFIAKRRFTCAEDLPIIDHFIFLQLGNEELKFRFQNNLRPVCMVSYKFLIKTCPHKWLIYYFLNSEIENVPSADCKAHIKWSNLCESNSWNRSLRRKKRTVSVHQITAQVLNTASQLKMKQLLKEFQISTHIPSFYHKRGLTALASKRPCHEAKGYFYGSETGKMTSKRNKTKNKFVPLRFLNFFKLSKKVVHTESTAKNKGTPKTENDLSKTTNDSNATCKLELQSSYQKTNHEALLLNNGSPNKRKLTSQSEKIKKTCSVPCLSSCINEILLEPDTSHYYVQQPDILPAQISKKLSAAQTVKENALKDDLAPSVQFSEKIACEKRPQPTHGMSAVSQTNVPAARNPTAKTSCEVSLDEKHGIGLVHSTKICDRNSEMKNKTLPTSFEVTQEPEVPGTVGQRTGTEAEYVSLHVQDKVSVSNSPTLQRTNSCKNSAIWEQRTDIDETSSTQASSKATQELPFPCKTTVSVSVPTPSGCARQKKSERAQDTNSDFTIRNKHATSCLLL